MVVPVGSDEEGLFLAGLVSSAPARYFVLSYTVSTQISTHVLEHVAIPTYVPTVDPAHAGMVAASNRARGACARGDSLALAAAEAELDEHARVLWGLSLAELTVIQRALRDLKTTLAKTAAEGEDDDS